MKITFDEGSCIRCGQCTLVCPNRLIFQDSPRDYPAAIDGADDFCISCNHCAAICPSGAVSVDGFNNKSCDPILKEAVPRFDQVTTLIGMRRSIRRYADKPVEDRLLEELLNVVRWAPSAKNGLPVRWIVVNNRQKVRELGELVIHWMETVPGLEAIVEAWRRGEDPIFRGAPCVVVAYTGASAIWPEVDTAIAVETLDLCVTAKRLGACWAGFFIRAAQHDPALNAWFGLSGDDTVHGGLMVGHIGEENYQRIPHRPEPSVRWIR